ncbi:hypothetical protein D3C76_1224220 [compost metagenome]
MAKQGYLEAHGVIANGDATLAQGAQSSVAVIGDNLGGEGGQGVFAQVFDQLLGFSHFGLLRGRLFTWRDLGQIALQRFLKR